MKEKIERVYAYQIATPIPNFHLNFSHNEIDQKAVWRLIANRIIHGKRPTLSVLFTLSNSHPL